jgi:hypothetical protein
MHLPINGNGETARLWGSQRLTVLVETSHVQVSSELIVYRFFAAQLLSMLHERDHISPSVGASLGALEVENFETCICHYFVFPKASATDRWCIARADTGLSPGGVRSC